MEVTKDFQKFVDSVDPNYHEIYDLYKVFNDPSGVQNSFLKVDAYGDTEDILIVYEPNDFGIRLTPKAAKLFPHWIIENLMKGEDPETYYAMESQFGKDPELRKLRNRG